LHLDDISLTLAAGALVLVGLEFMKSVWRLRLSS
jgi:hypothetical protein